MVSVAGNLYSVPDTTRRRIRDIHVFADEIRIFEDAILVAVHAPLEGRDKTHVDPAHRQPSTRSRRCPRDGEPIVIRRTGDQGRPPLARLLPGRQPSACRPGRRAMTAHIEIVPAVVDRTSKPWSASRCSAQPHFTRFFRDHAGVKPSEFRRVARLGSAAPAPGA
jgi:hypothetical protein